MELAKQIKKYRTDLGYSQDALAEKILVSRQTISNWENDKSYPDVSNLLLLSDIFQVSLDVLIKGDVDMMKEQVKQSEAKAFDKLSKVFALLLLGVIVLPVPLLHFLGGWGVGIWAVLSVITLFVALKVEKQKKVHNIQTYKEILAFTEGRALDEETQKREVKKRTSQKYLLALASGLVTLLVAIAFIWILKLVA